GLFVLSMMLRDGVKPEKAEAAMFSEIRKLQDKGPKPAELKKAVNQVRAQVEYARDGITANAYTIGNLGSFDALDELETLVDRVAAVSAEDVIRVARTYLQARNRTVGVFIPEGEAETPAGGPSPREAHSWSFPGRWRPLLPADVTPAGEAGNVAWPSLEAPWFAASLGAGTVDLPLIQKRVLDCGTTVFGIESRDSHCVAMAGFLRGGATLDPAGSEGLAYLTAHMLDEGTSRRNCRQIAAVTDKIGASISFGAGADSTDLGGKCLPRGLPKVLALLRECLSDLAAPEPELEKVRQQTVTAMKADRDSTRWLAARAAYEALYPPGHAYHRDHRGTLESIAGIRRETVLEFAAGAFGPQNLTLVLVGPLSFDRMCRQVDNALGSWQPLERVPAFQPLPVEVAASPGERVITVPGKSQCDLVVAQIAVPRSHPDYHALLVASSIFGRFGLMGRIGDRVRDEMGLAYYAYGFLLARTQAGHWEVMAGVNPANVRKALAAITEETRRFCSELVTEQELADTVGNLVGSLALRMETSDSLVYLARDIAFHNLPLDYLERFRAEVQNVTRDKVLALAQRYLADVEPVVVIAGPELPAGA
ncbi:MAG: M16 family metallopeptidase, partial [Planctomycetota bacterium]